MKRLAWALALWATSAVAACSFLQEELAWTPDAGEERDAGSEGLDAASGQPDGGSVPSDAASAEPDAGPLPPKLMLIVDRSGSMKTTVDSTTTWGCATDAVGNGYDPGGTCKWNTLKTVLAGAGGFLGDGAAKGVRLGLTIFPAPGASDTCAVGVVKVPVAAVPGDNTTQISAALEACVPSGGTPAAATMSAVSSDSAITKLDRAPRNYAVLITDGQPNCNASLTVCSVCTNGGDPGIQCGDTRNCQDDLALVQAVTALRAKNVDTFVIGFGSSVDTTPAKTALDAVAEAGGQALVGKPTKFYLATSDAALQAALDEILAKL